MASTKTLTIALLLTVAAASAACDNDKSADKSAADVSVVDASAPKAAAKEDATDTGANADDARQQASSPRGATVEQQPPLDISSYLSEKDLAKLTTGSVIAQPLVGKTPSPTYNATRLAVGGRDWYGAGLQVWKLDDKSEAANRLKNLRTQYLGVDNAPKGAPVGGDRAFVAERAGIQTYVFIPNNAPDHIAAVSCGQDLCKRGWKDVFSLADKVDKRAKQSQ